MSVICVRFEVLMAVRMMVVVMMFFWVLAPCGLIFSPEDGDSIFLQNTDIYQRVYIEPKSRISSSC
jgi:hypothetical protein